MEKRKNDDTHSDYRMHHNITQNNIIDNNITDRIKSKRARIDNSVNDCFTCHYDIIQDKCRCTINFSELNIDGTNIKLCNFCKNLLHACNCSVLVWSMHVCTICKLNHSIFDICKQTIDNIFLFMYKCVSCNKYSNEPNIECSCMHHNINLIITDK